MRILFIRHADPDYSIDSLTDVGKIEAELLAKRIAPMDIKKFYVSPLGRAKLTCEYTLKENGREAEMKPWLREFEGKSLRPDVGAKALGWDWRPKDWMSEPKFFDKNHWWEPEAVSCFDIKKEYDWVCEGIDEVLKSHGYERNGSTPLYKAVKANNDTIAFFCHFGVECVMLSHMLGVSPMILWHGTIAAPSSVTTVYTEERVEGEVSFRVASFGDISHLYVAGREPSFAGRFCESYTNFDERHD